MNRKFLTRFYGVKRQGVLHTANELEFADIEGRESEEGCCDEASDVYAVAKLGTRESRQGYNRA